MFQVTIVLLMVHTVGSEDGGIKQPLILIEKKTIFSKSLYPIYMIIDYLKTQGASPHDSVSNIFLHFQILFYKYTN